ncbi:hypothetical protein Dsin_032334 [Dipteronia sinensis]|uniref:1,8-cineole synthase n=1 Tax=Dipteronia sinensis TaxID=43782 RepID=A0AAD9ZMW0_9ROSI|nr:hypothetical protein Dsin_032334 [Dipteronia sinensis]
MIMEEYSPTTIALLLLRNLITSIFIFADKSLLNLSQKYKLLEIIRYLLVSSFLFFLRLIPSLFHSISQDYYNYPPKFENYNAPVPFSGGDSGISRALSQLLSIVGDIPVNSPKYQVVRSLAERLIDDNHRENVQSLDEINRVVLSAAFSRTLGRLEVAVVELGRDQVGDCGGGGGVVWGYGPVQYGLNRVFRVLRSVGEVVGGFGRDQQDAMNRPCKRSAQKVAAELLWLAQKMSACGFGGEAVRKWASASNLAWLALSAEPRLQGSLVKISTFLFNEAKELGVNETEEGKREQQRQTKVKMLLSWLPLLCRASNGVDVPVLSISEKAKLEKVLEETIDTMEEEEQEKVLSLWLHHFTDCPSSDWPNLHSSYARWYTASRKLLLLQ